MLVDGFRDIFGKDISVSTQHESEGGFIEIFLDGIDFCILVDYISPDIRWIAQKINHYSSLSCLDPLETDYKDLGDFHNCIDAAACLLNHAAAERIELWRLDKRIPEEK